MVTFDPSPDAGAAQVVVLSWWSVSDTIRSDVICALKCVLGWRQTFAGISAMLIVVVLRLVNHPLLETVEELPVVKPVSTASKETEKLFPRRDAALLGVFQRFLSLFTLLCTNRSSSCVKMKAISSRERQGTCR